MEEQSIFQTELSADSNAHILSAAKWSRFLAIVFFICAGFMLIAMLSIGSAMGNISEILSAAAVSNPQVALLENLPKGAFVVMMGIFLGLFILVAMMFLNIGRHGIAYHTTNDETAFIKTFKSAKTYFMVYSIITIISILFSLVGLFT